MAEHFDAGEARDPHGRWVKLAQGIRKLSEGDKGTVAKAIGELPQGGKGNRTSISGVEIRRHTSGGVNIKIGGESRHYSYRPPSRVGSDIPGMQGAQALEAVRMHEQLLAEARGMSAEAARSRTDYQRLQEQIRKTQIKGTK